MRYSDRLLAAILFIFLSLCFGIASAQTDTLSVPPEAVSPAAPEISLQDLHMTWESNPDAPALVVHHDIDGRTRLTINGEEIEVTFSGGVARIPVEASATEGI